MTPVQTAAALGSLSPSHAETGEGGRALVDRPPYKTPRAAAPRGWPGAGSQQGPGTKRPQKWEACEKEKRELVENFPAQHVFLMGSATWSKPKLSSGTC